MKKTCLFFFLSLYIISLPCPVGGPNWVTHNQLPSIVKEHSTVGAGKIVREFRKVRSDESVRGVNGDGTTIATG